MVDDAIVVIENISRYLEQGERPCRPRSRARVRSAFTIISLTISLVAVLIPLLFMGDVAGRLFRVRRDPGRDHIDLGGDLPHAHAHALRGHAPAPSATPGKRKRAVSSAACFSGTSTGWTGSSPISA